MQYLSVAETAERLGVKRQTVYAYVSRGLLTSVRSAERRGSRFAQDEVERLAARGRESDPPSGAVERIRTSLSLLSEDGLSFRGVPAVSLSSTEEAAGVLWDCDPPVFRSDPGRETVARGALAALPDSARLTDRVRVAVAAQAAADPLRADTSAGAVTATAAGLLGTTVAALSPVGAGASAVSDAAPGSSAAPEAGDAGPADGAGSAGGAVLAGGTARLNGDNPADAPHPDAGPRTPPVGCGEPRRGAAHGAGVRRGDIAERLWPVLGGPGPAPPAFRTALVLLADHGLAASTVAARVAASARADVYAVVSAGLGALDSRDHGLVSSQAHRFLADSDPDPIRALGDRLRDGGRVPGFGHSVYTGPDPRAQVLFGLLRDDPAASAVLACVDALVEGVARGGSLFPNVDLALAALMHAYGLRSDAGEAMFAVARTVGWVAHALEEYREPGLRFRPTGVYIGPRPA